MNLHMYDGDKNQYNPFAVFVKSFTGLFEKLCKLKSTFSRLPLAKGFRTHDEILLRPQICLFWGELRSSLNFLSFELINQVASL